jgi:hypothetical protein
MAWRKVEKYSLGYSIPSKEFRLSYRFAGEGALHRPSLTSSEFIALADMFRNGGRILFDPNEEHLFTEEREI